MATLAVTAAAPIAADAVGNPTPLSAQTLLDLANGLGANRDLADRLARRIIDLEQAVTLASEGNLSSLSEPVLRELSMSLNTARLSLLDQSRQSFLSQLLHQRRNKTELETLAEKIEMSYAAFTIQAQLAVENMFVVLEERSEASLLLSQVTAFTPRQGGADELPHPRFLLTALPPPPHLFFGREAERSAVTYQLVGSPRAHVAILGGPGLGKTSLALSVIHDERVAARFAANRFFISCESGLNLVGIIAGAFGYISSDPEALCVALRGHIGDPSSLMVLDNFESTWEPSTTRSEAEHVLRLLSELPLLSLIITMRGAERPSGVEWTRPFLPILRPLDDSAAMMTFLSICDSADSQTLIQQLVSRLDKIPLAVVLMASLAQNEPIPSLLTRWDVLKTNMLSRGRGDHRLNSVDVSLTLSIESPRMKYTPEAVRLLSLLALLPRGAMIADVEAWGSGMSSGALATLRRTALVTQTAQRLYVLAPIREFVLRNHPPLPDIAQPLYEHYFAWAAAIGKPSRSIVAGAMALVADDIENIEAVTRYALAHCETVEPALAAAASMCSLYSSTGVRFAGLITEALSVARLHQLHKVVGDLSYWWAIACWNTDSSGNASQMMEDARRSYKLAGYALGVVDASIQLLTSLEPGDASREGLRILASLEAHADSDARRIALCCREVALAYERGGHVRTARAFYARGVDALRAGGHGEDYLYGSLVTQMAICDSFLGALPGAIALLNDAIRILTDVGAVPGISEAEHQLGQVLLAQDDARGAVAHLRRAIELNRTAQWSVGCAFTFNLAVAYLGIGDEAGAVSAIEEAEEELSCGTQKASPPGTSWLLCARGELALWRGDVAEAHALLLAARTLLQSMRVGLRVENAISVPEELLANEAGVLDSSAKVYLRESNMDDAFTASLISSVIWAKLGRVINVVRSLTQLAYAASGDIAGPVLAETIPVLRQCGVRSSLAYALLRLAAVSEQSKDRDALGRFIMEASAILESISDTDGARFEGILGD